MKKILALVSAAVLAVGSLAAQVPGSAAASPKGNSETKVFAVAMGTGFAYDLAGKTGYATQTVAAVFGLTDAVQAGFEVVKGNSTAHSYNLVKLAVYPISDLSIGLEFGGDNTGTSAMASGFGIGYNIFRNSNAGLVTALQGNLGYRFGADIASGVLGFGLDLKVGL